jgi:hypothetical protein
MRLATQPLRKFSHNSGGKIRTEFFNTQLDARRNCIPLAACLLRRDPQPLSQPLCLCWDWPGGPDRTASSRCDQVIGPGWQRTSGTHRNSAPLSIGEWGFFLGKSVRSRAGTRRDGRDPRRWHSHRHSLSTSPHSWTSPKPPLQRKIRWVARSSSRGSPAGPTDCSCRACGGGGMRPWFARLVMRMP